MLKSKIEDSEMSTHLVLASASPRRAELLRAAGIEFDVMPADIDETMDAEEWPDGYVRRIALTKAEAVKPLADGRPVLAADTIVIVDSQVLGKPADADDAKRMLRLLSGREHTVMTAVCLTGGAHPTPEIKVERTLVEFAPLTDAEIDWYVASGEPMDKAGAYAIQGLASRFTLRINGSYSNVVGLPVAVVHQLCTKAGLLIS
jgi:septum formation protein